MTEKAKKLNQVHNILMELYSECVRVEVVVTYDGLEINTFDKLNIKDFSMRRINGEWVEKGKTITKGN